MKKLLFLLIIPFLSFGQNKVCGTMDILNKLESKNNVIKETRLKIEKDLQKRIGIEPIKKVFNNDLFDAFLKKYPHIKNTKNKLTKKDLYNLDPILYRELTRTKL